MSLIANIYMFKSVSHIYIYIFICGKQILGESKHTQRAFNLKSNIRWCFFGNQNITWWAMGDSGSPSMKNCRKVLRLSGASTKSFFKRTRLPKTCPKQVRQNTCRIGVSRHHDAPTANWNIVISKYEHAACMQSISPSWTHLSHGQNIQKSLQPPKSYPAKMLEVFKFKMWVTISSVYPLKKQVICI